MLDFNVLVMTETGERAYYVNGIRLDRPVWKAALENELQQMQHLIDMTRTQIAQSEICKRGAIKVLDGKASFPADDEARVFYRRVQREISDDIREMKFEIERLIDGINNLKERLED